MATDEVLQAKFAALKPLLDERLRRIWAGVEARAIGRGGISQVARATGLSRATVRAGVREIQAQTAAPGEGPRPSGRLRRAGAGRKALSDRQPGLLAALERHLEPVTHGEPKSPLRWTCRSAAHLATALRAEGHRVSERSVNRLLHAQGYSLQANRKTWEGRQHPDRDAQFQHLSQRVAAFQQAGQPVVSVDAKKKELIGPFQDGGRDLHPQGQPEEVSMHDSMDQEAGKMTPYGVTGLTANQGWKSVGVDADTAEFAVESLRRWWRSMGRATYPGASRLLITANGGGSNSSRSRLWKLALQEWADEVGLSLAVCHFPPATSKWTKIEHRMFSYITENWRGRPLVSREVVVNLIGTVTTEDRLSIQAELDENAYATGRKVTDAEMEGLSIERDDFHEEWNYTLCPRSLTG